MFSELIIRDEMLPLIGYKYHYNYDGILVYSDILLKYRAINQLRINNRILPLLFQDVRKIKFISKVECGLIHIREQRNDTG